MADTNENAGDIALAACRTLIYSDDLQAAIDQAREALEAHEASQRPATHCPACRRPADGVEYGGSCSRGGCPLGGDL